MISEKLDLIESFKKNQFSEHIKYVDSVITAALNSPKFNPRIQPFFQKRNTEGVPFTDFSLDPDNISQIKKAINALYHARLAFLGLENVDLRDKTRTFSDLKFLYSKTISEAYHASYLLTHLDVDIRDMFSEEFALILPILNKLQSFAESQADKTKAYTEKLKDYPLSYKVGEITGIAIEQMQPDGGDLDYNFLTQFSADLPGYIDKLTQYIEQYSTKIQEKEPALKTEKIEELQNAAFKLLNDLENLKGNSLFLSFKVINYIHIIRNIITLSMSSLEQVGNLSESSQDVIRDNLEQLKYVAIPSLFGLVDKIEDNAMVKPGTLSIPLMEKIKPFYAILIKYASKPVNFEQKGEELLSIEDSRFLTLRLENTYKRIDSANKNLFKIYNAEAALKDFYLILDEPQHRNRPIHQLPQDVKYKLIKQYKLIQPYMMQIDVHFDELMTQSLQDSESWSSFAKRHLRLKIWQNQPDHASFVFAHKEALSNLIQKKIATEKFHIVLNEDLIQSVQEQADLVLFPYSEKTNILSVDESTAIDPAHGSIADLQFQKERDNKRLTPSAKKQLTGAQALDLYQWYRNKHNKFTLARDAYIKFIAILDQHAATNGNILHIKCLDDNVKATCRNLYNIFQPYFIGGIPPEHRKSALSFDSYVVHALSNKEDTSKVPVANLFKKMEEHFQIYFTKIDINWNKESKAYLRLAHEKFESENDETELTHQVNAENRANHVIPHTHYSRFIREFRTALFQTTAMFNDAMQAELNPRKYNALAPGEELVQAFIDYVDEDIDASDIPYPELENKNKTLAQSKQVLAIKQIFNSLYHVEGIVRQLEELRNDQYQSKYVYHLLQAYDHINNIIQSTKSLAKDPHFGLIGRELMDKAQNIYAVIQEQSDAYQVSPDEIIPGEKLKYNGLWYTLNTFFVFPQHLRALGNNNYLTIEELEELHVGAKNSALRIEQIIEASNSYFKLFLQTPNMYRLYRDLTNKLNEFISTTHDTAIDNLETIKTEFFTPMLLQADLWEDKLGLKPGTLSDHLKRITDEYYKGLLHPLGLNSKTHIKLLCDTTPIDKRIESTQSNINSVKDNKAKQGNNYRHIEHLYQLIEKYQNLSSSLLPIYEDNLLECQADVIEAYKEALPKLFKLQKKLDIQPSKNLNGYKLDDILNESIGKYDPRLTQIITLVTASHHYYLGKQATHDMKLKTAKEKKTYLKELKVNQEKTNQLFIEDYTLNSFNKQMEALCNRHIGLQYTDKEYRYKLKNYLLTFQDQIMNNSKDVEDINLTIRNSLKEKISIFEKANFAKHYHLDTVRVALAQFKNYFSLSNSAIENNSSVFENEKTLEKKSERINNLIEITENENLSIEERLKQVQSNVKNPNFERIILAYKQADYFSFTYLKQCIVSLLEALYLYTPTRQVLLNDLNEAVNNQPKINELTKRFGLFATSTTGSSELSNENNTTESAETNVTPTENVPAPAKPVELTPPLSRKNLLTFTQEMGKKTDETPMEQSSLMMR